MIAFIGTWHIPTESGPEEWAQRYLEVHVPAVRRLPGLLRHTIGRTRDESGNEHWSAQLWFEDQAALDTAWASEEMKAGQTTGVMQDAEDVVMGPAYEMDDSWRGAGPA